MSAVLSSIKPNDLLVQEAYKDCHILIIDDDLDNIRVLGHSLKHFGYSVHVAKSGPEGLTRAVDTKPQLILLDLMMPGMDGYETCEHLKNNPRTKHIPVIFLSSLDEKEAVIKGFRKGAVDFITKPYHQEELLVRVRTHTTVGSMHKRLRQAVKYQTRELQKANTTLAGLASELVLSEERQRRELASNLHDSTIQKLALARIQMDAIASRTGDDSTRFLVERATESVVESLGELRSLMFDLSPPVLYELGLDRALEWLADETEKRWHIPIEHKSQTVLSDLPEETVVLLFRSTRELVMNIVKHAEATGGKIQTMVDDNWISILVEDNGWGFNPEHLAEPSMMGGFGLFSIKQRIELLGGEVHIKSGNSGTCITLNLPLVADD
ncbi:MAG: response regulator [Candidatus Sedimenticola sp. (ex Thyasira tokunagai)]